MRRGGTPCVQVPLQLPVETLSRVDGKAYLCVAMSSESYARCPLAWVRADNTGEWQHVKTSLLDVGDVTKVVKGIRLNSAARYGLDNALNCGTAGQRGVLITGCGESCIAMSTM